MDTTSDQLVKELIDRIGDHLNDPEPVHDQFLEKLSPHTMALLLRELRASFNQYKVVSLEEQ